MKVSLCKLNRHNWCFWFLCCNNIRGALRHVQDVTFYALWKYIEFVKTTLARQSSTLCMQSCATICTGAVLSRERSKIIVIACWEPRGCWLTGSHVRIRRLITPSFCMCALLMMVSQANFLGLKSPVRNRLLGRYMCHASGCVPNARSWMYTNMWGYTWCNVWSGQQ